MQSSRMGCSTMTSSSTRQSDELLPCAKTSSGWLALTKLGQLALDLPLAAPDTSLRGRDPARAA